jgi:hypothetical protein
LSSRKKRPETLIAKQLVSSAIKTFYESKKTPHGLPEDVVLRALEGYDTKHLDWLAVRAKALDFVNYASKHVSDCTIRRILRRPIGRKRAAASVSIFRLAARPLRSSETLFGAYTHTFTFWPSGMWFLSTTDPLFATDHLHQRLVERASNSYESLAVIRQTTMKFLVAVDGSTVSLRAVNLAIKFATERQQASIVLLNVQNSAMLGPDAGIMAA